MSGDFQSGYSIVDRNLHGSIWQGRADTWINLHSLLPNVYAASNAFAIYSSGQDIWVAGCAWRVYQVRRRAILWQGTVPEPTGRLTSLLHRLRADLEAKGGAPDL